MRNQTRTNQEAFIVKNIAQILETEGYPPQEVDRGCNEALRFYRTTASFARGKVFDSCLTKARVLLQPSKKAAKKNASRRGKAA
ncbi:hypothetical protein [Grimontia hollisae]|uniref:hypothetical protein n=1 Tax=Grimontia hollisae TaxID=673 RepID=UPI0013032F4D|nr:hypothetical protein [Grimontia hollisae]